MDGGLLVWVSVVVFSVDVVGFVSFFVPLFDVPIAIVMISTKMKIPRSMSITGFFTSKGRFGGGNGGPAEPVDGGMGGCCIILLTSQSYPGKPSRLTTLPNKEAPYQGAPPRSFIPIKLDHLCRRPVPSACAPGRPGQPNPACASWVVISAPPPCSSCLMRVKVFT